MKTATIVIAAYLLCIVVAAFWRLLPAEALRGAMPDIGAITAAHLGLTARQRTAAPLCGSVVLGYLLDVIAGTPAGLTALVLGLTCLVARAAQQRILVRGTAMTMAFSGFVALAAGVIGLLVRSAYDVPRPTLTLELKQLAFVTLTTVVCGTLVWRALRRIDAAFARTHRERDAALEGFTP